MAVVRRAKIRQMQPSRNIEHFIVEDEHEFDSAVNEYGIEVDVASEFAEKAYERLDSILANQIQELMMSDFGKDKDGIIYHQNWDWWPTCTRFLYLDPLVVRWKLVDQLRSLLVGELASWRVNVHVVSDMSADHSKEIGGLNVYSDWLLFQRSVYNLLSE
jgi:hypothetical protein